MGFNSEPEAPTWHTFAGILLLFVVGYGFIMLASGVASVVSPPPPTLTPRPTATIVPTITPHPLAPAHLRDVLVAHPGYSITFQGGNLASTDGDSCQAIVMAIDKYEAIQSNPNAVIDPEPGSNTPGYTIVGHPLGELCSFTWKVPSWVRPGVWIVTVLQDNQDKSIGVEELTLDIR